MPCYIPIYKASRGSVDKIDVLAAGSCRTKGCHGTRDSGEIARTEIVLMGQVLHGTFIRLGRG